jgi:hypothetical protein
MKSVLLTLALLIGFTSKLWAMGETDYLTNGIQDTTNSVLLTTPLCTKAYFVSKAYTIEPRLSSILVVTKANQKFAIQISISVRPQKPSQDAEFNGVLKSLCRGATPPLSPYPMTLVDFDLKKESGIPMSVNWSSLADMFVVQLEVDPQSVSLSQLLKVLKQLRPQQIVHAFEKIQDAYVSLAADYSASANFFENYYSDKQCRMETTCHRFLGFGGCRHSESCVDIPHMKQVLQNSHLRSSIRFDRDALPNVSKEKLDEMENTLLSRLVRSLYTESRRDQIGDVTVVTLGQLKKENSGQFTDHISMEHLTDKSFVSNFWIDGLVEFAQPILKKTYDEVARGESK